MKKFFIFLLCFFIWLTKATPSMAQTVPVAGSSAILNRNKEIKRDLRIKKIKNFLMKYNSPLLPYSHDIINQADLYEIDYRLVVAISGVESTFCHAIPYNSYNCWGWRNGDHFFKNYSEAIEIVSRTLGQNYIKRGFDTPESIGPIYAPPSSDWGWKVRYFMNLLQDDVPAAFLAKQFSI